MGNNGNDKSNTRHHYVQKAYLDGFAVKERIDVILREDGTARKSQRTTQVANERGLYTITRDNGDKDGILEDIFANEVEGPAIKIIQNMTSVLPYVPKGAERQTIAEYMALQYLRTPEAKRRFEVTTGQLASIKLFNIAHDEDELRAYLKKKGDVYDDEAIQEHKKKILESLDDYEIVPNSTMWYKQIIDGIPLLVERMIKRYGWHLLYFDKPSLLTGDHPVIVRNIYNNGLGTGFANADEILFPLTVHYALLLSIDPEIPEEVNVRANPEVAEMMNWFIKHNSFLEIYSHPSLTSEYVGEALGQKILMEMGGGAAQIPEAGFLKKYVGTLERKRPNRS